MKKISPLGFILSVYLSGIVIFALFRIAAVVLHCADSGLPEHLDTLFLQAMGRGWHFDTVVCCYLLSVPLLLAAVGMTANIRSRAYYRVGFGWIGVGFTLFLLASVADLAFYRYFSTRLNAVAVNEVDSFGIIANMIVSEPTYLLLLLLLLVFVVGYWIMLNRWFKHFHPAATHRVQSGCTGGWHRIGDISFRTGVSLLLILLCCWGMRGNLTHKTPIRMCESSFCNDPFFNQIGLNPVFTYVKSAEEVSKNANEPPRLMEAAEAEAVYRAERATPLCDSLMLPGLDLPLPRGTNVVLVMMESMTVDKTGLFNPSHSLTPHLDSLMTKSLTFAQLYSAGIHTYNGIYSTLYSYPAILARHTLKHARIPQMHGIPHVLHNEGYQTAFFMTHTDDFDNMRGFLYCNGFDSVFGRQAYPADAPEGTWGVPDHIMFDHALDYCSRAARRGPFFAVMMTCSDHPPISMPHGIAFHPTHGDDEHAIVQYADWAIGRFLHQAARQPWFRHTLFVFVGDHGTVWGDNAYDMPLSLHHVPLLFHYPGHIKPQRCNRLATQMDIMPTLLGMLPMKWENDNFGLDLLRQQRRYAYFSADDRIGVLDGEYFYIYRTTDDSESLYHYSDTNRTDCLPLHPQRARDMQHYAFGLIQHSYYKTNSR